MILITTKTLFIKLIPQIRDLRLYWYTLHSCPEGQSWDKKWHGSFVKWNLWIQPLKTLHHWNSNFCWALLKIFQYEKFEIQYQKYLTTEKYFEYLRRCKIEELWPSFCMSDATKATSKSLEKKNTSRNNPIYVLLGH